MPSTVQRRSVDLSDYPDLVVVYLGMRVKRLRGLATVLGIGRGRGDCGVVYGFNHIGMRHYWRDLESMERFTRSEPHRD